MACPLFERGKGRLQVEGGGGSQGVLRPPGAIRGIRSLEFGKEM